MNLYHEEVERLAATHDGGYLTAHAREHIKTVIERASQLVFSPEFNFNPNSDESFTPDFERADFTKREILDSEVLKEKSDGNSQIFEFA